MSFFNENDIETIKNEIDKIDKEKADKYKEKLNRDRHADIFAKTMFETFTLFKAAAKEYPRLCRSVGIKPGSYKSKVGWFTTIYELYDLRCRSISADFSIGVTKDGELVEFKVISWSEKIYVIQDISEWNLKKQFVCLYNKYASAHDGSILEYNDSGLMWHLLLFSFPVSYHYDSYYNSRRAKITLYLKSKEEIRESIKKFFLDRIGQQIN